MLARAFLTKIKRRAQRLASPISSDKLRRALDEVTGGGRDILYVHSGISSIGYFTCGPAGIARVLREFCDTLFQSTHTYSYPPSPEVPAPVFDARSTPSQMGLFAETFWRLPGVVRSIHSSHSIAAEGKLAAQVCAKHYDCSTATGEGTPYSQLVHRGAPALMFGIDFRFYTPFHTAEWESGSVFAYEPEEVNRLRFLDENRVLQERLVRRQNRIVPRFDEAGLLLESKGFVRRVSLGRSALLFVSDMSKVHEFCVERLKRIPDFLRSTCKVELA
jgi:aminoglycoside N3'-acetyltransferase